MAQTAPCTLSSTKPSVTICEPANGATVPTRFKLVAAANDDRPVTAMKIYVDYKEVFSTSYSQINTTVTVAAGKHTVQVKAWNAGGTSYYKTIGVTAVDSTTTTSGSCPGSSTYPAVLVCTPVSGSPTGSPLRVVARAQSRNTIRAMKIYLDYREVFSTSAAQLDTWLSPSTGSHNLTVQAWDSSGAVFKSSQTVQTLPIAVEDVVTNISAAWALAFAPDGRLFFTEQVGRLRVVDANGLRSTPVLDLHSIVPGGESGMLGLAVDPNFSSNHYLYLYYCYWSGDKVRARVARLVESNNTAYVDKVLLDWAAARQHNGGRLKIGPDGRLYISTGDQFNPPLAQNKSSYAGKILRINRDGSIPGDNPFGASPVYSYGHRNVQGLAFDGAGQLWATEHGPTMYDEVNLIRAGGNYGWPDCVGRCGSAYYVDPVKLFSSQTAAPAGAVYYRSTAISAWTGSLLFGSMGLEGNTYGRHVHRLRFNSGSSIGSEQSLLLRQLGRIRDVIEGPGGAVYVSTTNASGGTARPGDDRIVRLRPR